MTKKVYGRKLDFHKLHVLIILGDVLHQHFLHNGSSLFLSRPLILHAGRLIQVLILSLSIDLSLMEVVIVGELLGHPWLEPTHLPLCIVLDHGHIHTYHKYSMKVWS